MSDQSDSIADLAAALAKAQGAIVNAQRDVENAFFKKNYATLASTWDACRMPLSDNGLAVIQAMTENEKGFVLVTTLAHASGQWMRSHYPVTPVKNDPQGLGSALTYARRYALGAIVGVAPADDDDGETAVGRGRNGFDSLPHDRHRSDQERPKPKASKTKSSLPADEESPLIDLDKDYPPANQKCKELPAFCASHSKLKDYMGIPFFDFPFEALNSIGDIMRKGLDKSEGNKREWYEWIVNGLLEELAERAALDGPKAQPPK